MVGSKSTGDLLMFSKLLSTYRLSLCLLISMGVHGSVVFSDWMTSPAESRLVQAPVVVSLLPAMDISSPLIAASFPSLPETVPSTMKSRVVASASPRTVQKSAAAATLFPTKMPEKP